MRKKKKIITPDDYNTKVEIMIDEIDTEMGQEIMKTPSMEKIMKQIPSNIRIHKINEKSTSEKSLIKQQ